MLLPPAFAHAVQPHHADVRGGFQRHFGVRVRMVSTGSAVRATSAMDNKENVYTATTHIIQCICLLTAPCNQRRAFLAHTRECTLSDWLVRVLRHRQPNCGNPLQVEPSELAKAPDGSE